METRKLKRLDETDSDYLQGILKDLEYAEIRMLALKVENDHAKYANSTIFKIRKIHKTIIYAKQILNELTQ